MCKHCQGIKNISRKGIAALVLGHMLVEGVAIHFVLEYFL